MSLTDEDALNRHQASAGSRTDVSAPALPAPHLAPGAPGGPADEQGGGRGVESRPAPARGASERGPQLRAPEAGSDLPGVGRDCPQVGVHGDTNRRETAPRSGIPPAENRTAIERTAEVGIHRGERGKKRLCVLVSEGG